MSAEALPDIAPGGRMPNPHHELGSTCLTAQRKQISNLHQLPARQGIARLGDERWGRVRAPLGEWSPRAQEYLFERTEPVRKQNGRYQEERALPPEPIEPSYEACVQEARREKQRERRRRYARLVRASDSRDPTADELEEVWAWEAAKRESP